MRGRGSSACSSTSSTRLSTERHAGPSGSAGLETDEAVGPRVRALESAGHEEARSPFGRADRVERLYALRRQDLRALHRAPQQLSTHTFPAPAAGDDELVDGRDAPLQPELWAMRHREHTDRF